MEKTQLLVNAIRFQLMMERLALEVIENHSDFKNTVIIGLQPRGVFVSKRIVSILSTQFNISNIAEGSLDTTFFRDDFREHQNPLIPQPTKIDVEIENKRVLLVDDVLFTGRTIRSGMEALLSFGRPKKVELLVLIDRLYSRDLPIQADYSGLKVDTINSQRVIVNWKETEKEDSIWLVQKNSNHD